MLNAEIGNKIIGLIGIVVLIIFALGFLYIKLTTSGNKKSNREKLEDYQLPLYSTPFLGNLQSIKHLGFHTTSIFTGVSWYSEMIGNFTNTFGGKSRNFEMEFEYIKKETIKKFKIEVLNRFDKEGVNAVINLHLDFEILNLRKGVMFALIVSGDAVKIN